MTTAQFNHFKLQPTERTPITIIPSGIFERCYNCKDYVHPNVIVSQHSDKPLSVCPRCNSLIQHMPGTAKRNGRTNGKHDAAAER